MVGMPEGLKIIWILAVGFGLACALGYLAHRLRLSPLLGYLLAGYFIGPNFPGFVADPRISEQLANIGVTLLMFAVGLNFNWKDLSAVKSIAVPGALILSMISIISGVLLSLHLGLTIQAGFVIGLAICVSSTVVIVRVLADQNLLKTPQGHTVVGWTIVEDLISVFGMLLLPSLAIRSLQQGHPVMEFGATFLLVIAKIVVLGLLIYYIGEKVVDKLLKIIARTRSHELFTLAILSCVFFIAIGSSYVFGVSLALGAFIAGTVVGKTEVSHQAAANALPMRDAFAVIFFLSVGMLFNPTVVSHNLPLFFGILGILLILRPVIAFLIVTVAQYPRSVAFTVAIAISQIGEYSFILAEEGSNLKILPDNAYDIIVAAAFVTIALNPFIFRLLHKLTVGSGPTQPVWMDGNLISLADKSKESFRPRALVVGYGPVGQAATHYLLSKKQQTTIIEQNIDTVTALKAKGIDALFGDATQFQIMEKIDLANIQLMVITTPDFEVTQGIIAAAQEVNPHIKIVARCHYHSDREATHYSNIPIVCDEEAAAEKIVAILKPYFA